MVRLTIFTAAYNSSKHIDLTIQSIINQTFTDWEYFVFDDGSTDNTKQIVANYVDKDSRIKYFCLDHIGNPAIIRNIAIKKGSGEWFANCDHDDIWHPLKLELQFNLIDKLKLDSIVFTAHVYFTKPNNITNLQDLYNFLKIIQINNKENVSGYKIKNNSLLNGNYIMFSSTIVNRKVYEQIGLLSEESKLRGIEDYEFWLRCACNGLDIFKIDEILSFWSEHEGNLSKDRTYQREQEIVRMINKARKCKNMKIEHKFNFYYSMNFMLFSISKNRFHEKRSLFNLSKYIYFRAVFRVFVLFKKLNLF